MSPPESHAWLLTGPPAAGKNAVAEEMAAQFPADIAVIDVDDLRHLIHDHVAPWEGERGRHQHELGARNAISLADNFARTGVSVVILDVVDDELASIYRLGIPGLVIVQLLPARQVVRERNRERPVLSTSEVRMLDAQQRALTSCDRRIDNSRRAPAEVAAELLSD